MCIRDRFISAPENVAWILNIRGGDGPNSPVPNCRLIVSKNKKIYLISNNEKSKNLIKEKIIKSNELIHIKDFPKKILQLRGYNFIVDNNSCSIYFENIIKSTYPEVVEIRKVMESNSSLFVSLSGSGSTMFGVYDNLELATNARSLFKDFQTYIALPVN